MSPFRARNEVRYFASFVAGAIGIGAGSMAWADDASTGGESLQVVEVLGQRDAETFARSTFSTMLIETSLLEIPQSISAVTSETISEHNLMQLNDIAPFVAGVNEFSVYDDLTIRGFRSSDDRRVNGLRTYNNFWSQPYIANLERIEVIKGPAAATFGDATPGGVINLITKKPLTESRQELTASLGSYDRYYAAFDTTGPLDEGLTLPYRLNLSAWNIESFRNQAFDEGFSIAPSLSWLAGERTRLNLDVVYTDRDTVLDRGQPNVQGADTLGIVPIDVMVTQPGDQLDTQTLSVALAGDQQLSDRWTLAARYMYFRYEEDLIEHRIQNFVSPSVIRMGYTDRDTEATVNSGVLYLAGEFATGRFGHRLVIGGDVVGRDSVSDQVSSRDAGTFDLLAPVYAERDPSTYTVTPLTYGGEFESYAGFVQDQVTIGRWEMLAGVRYTSFTDRTIDAPEESYDSWSPRLGVVYRLSDDISLYGTWLEGFEAQFGYSSAEGGPFGPTTSELYEAGYKQLAFGGKLLFTAALYQLTNNDIVVYANDPANPDLYRVQGEERARGVEFEVSGRPMEQLTLLANYAYNDAEITDDTDPALVGRTKENAPRHAGTLWGRYDFRGGFGVGAGLTYVGERETFDAALQLPAYTLVNAAVYYRRGPLALSLQGRNLTDETHWTGGYNFGRVFPGDPRSAIFSATYAF
jgi:iron complex outermembrane receptor protein